MNTVDLNCDMGEGYESDPRIMPLVTSANVACGFHASDPGTIPSLTMSGPRGWRIGGPSSW